MQLATVTPSPNGSVSVFNVSPAPLTTDHAFVFLQTQWLERVTSAPAAGQYAFTGSTLTLWTAPHTDERLAVFVSTDDTKMLVLENLTPQIDGTIAAFTIAAAIQGGSGGSGVFEEGVFEDEVFGAGPPSEPILVFNTRALHKVTADPAMLEYTRTDQAVTLGFVPVVGDSLHALVQTNRLTGATFTKQVIAGLRDGENRFFRFPQGAIVGFDHLTLMNQGSRILVPDPTPPPESTVHVYDTESGVVEVFTPPLDSDSFIGWVVGIYATPVLPFVEWLKKERRKVYFADVGEVKLPLGYGQEPFGEEVGAKRTEHFASEPYTTLASDTPPNLHHEGFIKSIPTTTRSMRSALGDNALVTYSSLLLANESAEGSQKGRLDTTFGIGGWATDGQTIVLSMGGQQGDLPFADRHTLIRGTAKIQRCTRATVEIPLNDDSGQLLRPIPMQPLTRAEFPLLPEDSEGQHKPDVYGYVFNLSPYLVNPVTQTYLVSRLPIAGVDAVFDNGIPVGFTFDAVRRDRFSLHASPVGQVTCNVRGYIPMVSRGFSARVGDVLEDYLRRFPGYGVTQIHPTWVRLFRYEAPWDVGLVIREPRAPQDVLDDLLRGFPCGYYFTREGKFVIRFLGTISNRAPRQRFIRELDSKEVDPPLDFTQRLKQVTLGYKKNETVQNSLVTAISAGQRAFVQAEYRRVQHYDGAVATLFPESLDEEAINTCISNRTHAEALARKRLNFFRTVHPKIRESFDMIPLLLDLGAECSYVSNLPRADGTIEYRYQLGEFAPVWMVMRMEEQHLMGGGASRVTLELMQ